MRHKKWCSSKYRQTQSAYANGTQTVIIFNVFIEQNIHSAGGTIKFTLNFKNWSNL